MNEKDKDLWFVYILRCEDDSLYTGITNNLEKRYKKHLNGTGAKYTKIRKPKEICIFFMVKNRSEASKLEVYIKKLSKKEKEFLILDEKNKKIFIKNVKIFLNIEINL